MEESVSWRGHSFTLLVFAGIVVLCSIFFILGMLVGRNQGQRLAEIAAAETRPKPAAPSEAASEDKKPEPVGREAPSEDKKPAPTVREAPSPKADPPAPQKQRAKQPPAAANVINLQVGAMSRSNAEKLLKEMQTRSFPAFILAPPTGDPSSVYRVQVGPYGSQSEAEAAKRKLESLGYKPIMKK